MFTGSSPKLSFFSLFYNAKQGKATIDVQNGKKFRYSLKPNKNR